MRRREFIKLVGGVATWPLAAVAQPLGKPPTIGLLLPNTVALDGPRVGALVRRLRELGWIEGRNIALEYRWADGRTEHLAGFRWTSSSRLPRRPRLREGSQRRPSPLCSHRFAIQSA